MNDPTPAPAASAAISAYDLNVAQVQGDAICQPRVTFTNLSVVHRTPDNGGGVLLRITSGNQETRFVLDEYSRAWLVQQLSVPGEPINLPAART